MKNGLLSTTAMTPTASGGPTTSPPQDEQPNVTPDEQADYDRFVGNALKIVYKGGQVNPAILKSLAAGDPIDSLVRTSVNIVSNLVRKIENSGKHLDASVIYHGGKAIMEDLAELAGKARIHDFSEEDLKAAWLRAVDMYQSENSDQIDKQAVKQEFGQMVQADRQGKLGEMIPQLGQYAKEVGQQAPAQQQQPSAQSQPQPQPQGGAQ